MGYFVPPTVVALLDRLVQDETRKRQYYRPIYSVHKWWARRPGALFRALVLLAARPHLADGLLLPGHDGSPSPLSPYFQGHNLEDVIILDPFMGGGTTLVEAHRLGAKVIGSDINPVAYWTVRETLKPLDLERLDDYFRQLEATAGVAIRELYRTNCPICNRRHGEGMYAFWVRFITCPSCGQELPLHKRTLLNKGERRNRPISSGNQATVFCPYCYDLNLWDGKGEAHCSSCGKSFDPRHGTYNQGMFVCLHCGQRGNLLATLRRGQRLQDRLVAIEYLCPTLRRRLYKAPDAADLAHLESIERKVQAQWEHLRIPRQPIPPGASSQRWRAHGYTHYHQVFNARQLLALHTLLEAIAAIPEREYRDAFLTVFSTILEYNNMMTPYNYPHRKLHHLFTYHAMPLTTTPVENAVWGAGREGAGTFVNGYYRYREAKRYARRPYEKFRDSKGTIHTVYPDGECIAGQFVSSFSELVNTPRGVWLFARDSASLPEIPDHTVDLVITDPPYYDNIHYSELSNFFYVWLRLLTDAPAFAEELVPTDAEAIVNPGHDKGEDEYRRLLTAVFCECHRVLKNTGRLIFTFHHKNPRAWWTMLAAVSESGFQIIEAFPIQSEYKVNPHVRGKQSLDMDLVLVCEQRPASLPSQSHLSGSLNPVSNYLYRLGRALAETSAAWDVHPVSPEEWENLMNVLWEEVQDIPDSPRYDAPKPTQLRLLEKSE